MNIDHLSQKSLLTKHRFAITASQNPNDLVAKIVTLFPSESFSKLFQSQTSGFAGVMIGPKLDGQILNRTSVISSAIGKRSCFRFDCNRKD